MINRKINLYKKDRKMNQKKKNINAPYKKDRRSVNQV